MCVLLGKLLVLLSKQGTKLVCENQTASSHENSPHPTKCQKPVPHLVCVSTKAETFSKKGLICSRGWENLSFLYIVHITRQTHNMHLWHWNLRIIRETLKGEVENKEGKRRYWGPRLESRVSLAQDWCLKSIFSLLAFGFEPWILRMLSHWTIPYPCFLSGSYIMVWKSWSLLTASLSASVGLLSKAGLPRLSTSFCYRRPEWRGQEMGSKCPGLLGNTGPKCELPLRAAYSIGQGKYCFGPSCIPRLAAQTGLQCSQGPRTVLYTQGNHGISVTEVLPCLLHCVGNNFPKWTADTGLWKRKA